MRNVPNEKELYKKFDERGHQMVPRSLMPYFEEDVHELVDSVKQIIEYALSGNPDAYIDADDQVIKKIEVWKNSKEKNIAYEKYIDFAQDNSITHERVPYTRFVEPEYYQRWQKIELLGIKVGSVVRIKGQGDDYTVRGISAYLTVGVKESGEHFNPKQIVSVIFR